MASLPDETKKHSTRFSSGVKKEELEAAVNNNAVADFEKTLSLALDQFKDKILTSGVQEPWKIRTHGEHC